VVLLEWRAAAEHTINLRLRGVVRQLPDKYDFVLVLWKLLLAGQGVAQRGPRGSPRAGCKAGFPRQHAAAENDQQTTSSSAVPCRIGTCLVDRGHLLPSTRASAARPHAPQTEPACADTSASHHFRMPTSFCNQRQLRGHLSLKKEILMSFAKNWGAPS